MKKRHTLLTGITTVILLSGCNSESKKPQEGSRVENTQKAQHKTASGLSYEILTPAKPNAQSPKNGDTVVVHYTGWLDDNGQLGKKFDSSVDRGMPFKFILGKKMVIAGWDEGVAMMKVGEKRRLTIPANLGYGQRGFPGAIPGNATLIFDVELLDIA